jgi:predicted nucleic acid-binding protein
LNACVVDASVAIKWYVPEVHSEAARGLLVRQIAGDLSFHVPDIYVAEIGNVLWKKVRSQLLERQKAWNIAAALLGVPATVYASGPLLPAALDLALAHDRTVYDSLYLSLAASLGCPLVTADAKFRAALAKTHWNSLVLWVEDV